MTQCRPVSQCGHLFPAPHAQVGSGYASECPAFSGFDCLTLTQIFLCCPNFAKRATVGAREGKRQASTSCSWEVHLWMKGAGRPGHWGLRQLSCPGHQCPSCASWHQGPDEGPASLHMERDTGNVWLGLSEDDKEIRPRQTALDELRDANNGCIMR